MPVAQMVENLFRIQETQVQSLLSQEDPEKRMATHLYLPENAMDRGTWQLLSVGLQRVGHNYN